LTDLILKIPVKEQKKLKKQPACSMGTYEFKNFLYFNMEKLMYLIGMDEKKSFCPVKIG
jgi:hypothetical protein